jgi:hypothetical protein
MRFSLAIQQLDGALGARLRHVLRPAPANDNAREGEETPVGHGLILGEVYGERVRDHAKACARRAFFQDDMATYRWWLEMLRLLDRQHVETSH